jgi:hypothetical protein
MIIASGSPPPNPAELLGSTKMGQILNQISTHVDIVVIDTPPSLVADAQILAARVDAVLFVIQPGVTRTDMAKAAMESFKRSGARIVGVVMNRIPRNRGYYYGGYKYYSSHAGNKKYYSEDETKPSAMEDVQVTIQPPRQTAAEQPVQKPVQRSTGNEARHQVQQQPVQSMQNVMEMTAPYPGNNGKPMPGEFDDEDEHPSVDKLFENVTALPNRNTVKTNNNGHK